MLIVVRNRKSREVDSYKFDDEQPLHLRLKEVGCEADTHEIIYLEDPCKNYSDEFARGIIEKEGIGYAVSEHTGYYCFANPVTRELWKNASEALNALAAHLKIEGASDRE